MRVCRETYLFGDCYEFFIDPDTFDSKNPFQFGRKGGDFEKFTAFSKSFQKGKIKSYAAGKNTRVKLCNDYCDVNTHGKDY